MSSASHPKPHDKSHRSPSRPRSSSRRSSVGGDVDGVASPDVQAADDESSERAVDGEAEQESYSIDELAALTGVPSRTIRYYQSKGTLPAPERRGRVAVYGPEHKRRLEMIADLQQRGLRLDAIREVIVELEQGRNSLNDWLGVGDHLQVAWTDDRAVVLSEEELHRATEAARPLFLSEAQRVGMVQRQGNSQPATYLVPSPRMLDISVRLDVAGIDLSTAVGAQAIVRRRMAKATDELVDWFAEHIGQGFGGAGDAGGVARSMDALRPTGVEAVQLVFAQEMERSLRRFVESGRVMDKPRRSKRS